MLKLFPESIREDYRVKLQIAIDNNKDLIDNMWKRASTIADLAFGSKTGFRDQKESTDTKKTDDLKGDTFFNLQGLQYGS